jgi:hypothetical protein
VNANDNIQDLSNIQLFNWHKSKNLTGKFLSGRLEAPNAGIDCSVPPIRSNLAAKSLVSLPKAGG